MGVLDQVAVDDRPRGQRIVIAGTEKVGKTTLASGAPNAMLVQLERGDTYTAKAVPKTPLLNSWEQVEMFCDEVIAAAKARRSPIPAWSPKPGSTIIWDTATKLETLIHDYVIRTDATKVKNPTMETAHGAYGKAYAVANDVFWRWTQKLDELAIYGGINHVITCHVFASLVKDPMHGEYHTWDLQLHSPKNEKQVGKRELITQWADMIGFLYEPMIVSSKEDKGLQQAISLNQGRMLGVDRAPQWVAGNRYNMSGVVPIPVVDGWNALAHAVYNSTAGKIDLFTRA